MTDAAAIAEQELRQTFTNLQFEEFGPAPLKGQVYQAIAGGRVIYFAPQSQHILFGAIYDKNGLNVTAMTQSASAQKRLGAIDPADALVIGPAGAPKVIEFTDPDCPYCQALERFWIAKASEGKPVQRLIYFVGVIHPEASAKAEHILCSPNKEAAFKAMYAGARPATLLKCKAGADKVARDAETVRRMGVSGTPTLFVDGKLINGFQQAELETFLTSKQAAPAGSP
ncbi:thiol:disulfide interchange protein DsbC [Sphingobium sp. B2D3A]|nr:MULTISPECIES: DsbC family protein [unclassified Sphingobium]MCW2338190.1 thiol:disulfide interchange protein DsbC [Sphingobium sp. B2D3A]MCW2384649.1 thiol:disulfide interchange protein DsbC [Sphingobium sp. B2D3D]